MIRLETTADRVIGAPHDPPARGERFLLRVPLGALGRGRLGLGLIGRGLAPVAALPLGLTSRGRRCIAVGEQIGELGINALDDFLDPTLALRVPGEILLFSANRPHFIDL